MKCAYNTFPSSSCLKFSVEELEAEIAIFCGMIRIVC